MPACHDVDALVKENLGIIIVNLPLLTSENVRHFVGREWGSTLCNRLVDSILQGEKPKTHAEKEGQENETKEQAAADRWAEGEGWPMPEKMKDKLREAFKAMDENNNGMLEHHERMAAATTMTTLAMEYGISVRAFDGIEKLTEEEFFAHFQREWELGRKEQALSGYRVVRAIAECVSGGSPEDPLGCIDGLSDEEMGQFVQETVGRRLKETFLEERRRKTREKRGRGADAAGGAGEDEGGGKALEGKYGAELRFGKLEDFFGGLVDKIGLPDPNLMEGMRREHCDKADSKNVFSPGNYDISTTPEGEWLAVVDREEGERVSAGPRKVKAASELLMHSQAKEAGLIEAEVTALVLYTGPMFRKYNAVLRGFPQKDVDALEGNKYATTIHLIVSGIIKLSKEMTLPATRRVYRGLAGGLDVPNEFKMPDKHGVRGGVEYGMMSTTLERSVALQYAGGGGGIDGGLSTIFEIEVSAVSRGASLGFLSQFEGEAEILIPPLSFLEVVGDARVETGKDGGLIRVIPLAVSANVTGSTIEGIVGKRKQLHMFQMENAVHEIKRRLEELVSSSQAKSRRELDPSPGFVDHSRLAKKITRDANSILNKHRERNPEWYNVEEQIQGAMRELAELRGLSVGVFEYWLDDPKASLAKLQNLSMHDVDRQKTRQIVREMEEIESRSSGAWKNMQPDAVEGELRQRALQLCKRRGGIAVSIDEENELGEPPLVAAGARGDFMNLHLLLVAGCSIGSVSSKTGQTALHTASMTGYKDSVWLLLERRADVVAKDNKGRTSLHFAAEGGHLKICDILIEMGGAELLEARDQTQRTALMIASGAGHFSVVSALLSAGAQVDAETNMSNRALNMATENGHCEIVDALIKARADVNVTKSLGNKYSALMTASSKGYIDIVKELLGAGADLDCLDKSGDTAFMIASREGHCNVVRALLDAGVDVNQTGSNGATGLMQSLSTGQSDLVKTLLGEGANANAVDNDGWTALMEASSRGHSEAVKDLVAAGANVNAANKNGRTGLIQASSGGYCEVVKDLIEACADVNAPDKDGYTPLIMASNGGHYEVVKALLEAKAEVNAAAKAVGTALIVASTGGGDGGIQAWRGGRSEVVVKNAKEGGGDGGIQAWRGGHSEVVNALIAAGAQVNAENVDGDTALTLSSFYGHIQVVKALITAGANVNAMNKAGDAALARALPFGHSLVVTALLNAGADPNSTNQDGETVLSVASCGGHSLVVKALVEAGVDVNASDGDGYTSLYKATMKGNLAVVRTLLEAGAAVNAADKDGETALMQAAYGGHAQVAKDLLQAGAAVNAVDNKGETALGKALRQQALYKRSVGHLEVVKVLEAAALGGTASA